MARFFIFGLGYSASRIAAMLEAQGWEVIGTGSDATLSFDDQGTVRMALADASHVLSSVPPGGEGLDPVLARYGDALGGKWLGYLSSTGVYGDTGGAWVDESAPTGTGRRTARAVADAEWLALGARVLRLPGIYGPGRSPLDRVREGQMHRERTASICRGRCSAGSMSRILRPAWSPHCTRQRVSTTSPTTSHAARTG